MRVRERIRRSGFLLFPIALAFLCGCGVPHQTPKLIVADGSTYAACQNTLWVSSSSGLLGGDTSYEIKFTDADGIDHDIRGIKRLEMTDLPETIPGTLPEVVPDPKTDKDGDGKPYVEGTTIYWRDGNSATLKNGTWVAAPRPNPVCRPTR